MFRKFLNRQTVLIARIGARLGDTEEIRLHKQLVTATALMTGLAGFVWGLLYFSFGEWLSGWIPFAYGIVTYLNVALFAATGNVRLLRSSTLAKKGA